MGFNPDSLPTRPSTPEANRRRSAMRAISASSLAFSNGASSCLGAFSSAGGWTGGLRTGLLGTGASSSLLRLSQATCLCGCFAWLSCRPGALEAMSFVRVLCSVWFTSSCTLDSNRCSLACTSLCICSRSAVTSRERVCSHALSCAARPSQVSSSSWILRAPSLLSVASSGAGKDDVLSCLAFGSLGGRGASCSKGSDVDREVLACCGVGGASWACMFAFSRRRAEYLLGVAAGDGLTAGLCGVFWALAPPSNGLGLSLRPASCGMEADRRNSEYLLDFTTGVAGAAGSSAG
mmetsp:Transcript_26604/g.61123  ORF Transcript_26604/g.61123 Transcript_26604/m.61123 type:complete len:292 (+) Transcript_26604:477-1352(+)